MTPFAKHLHQSFQMALEAKPATHGTPTDELCEWEQTCRMESIARQLAECGAFQLRQMPKKWGDLSPDVQERFKHKAERAIVSLDLSFMERAMEQACQEVEDWMNGHGNPKDQAPSVREIGRELLAIYESILSAGPKVSR